VTSDNLYRTDKQSSVVVRSDGQTVEVQTEKQRTVSLEYLPHATDYLADVRHTGGSGDASTSCHLRCEFSILAIKAGGRQCDWVASVVQDLQTPDDCPKRDAWASDAGSTASG
jgi:hypothetical protein